MASRGVNKVILVGNLGNDPEIRYMPSGGAVANISIATSESWKDKNTGEDREKTEWHKIAIFGKLAEIAGEYLRKGSQVYIEGQLQTRKWQDDNGQDRYTTEVVVQGFNGVMQMLGSRDTTQPDRGANWGQPQQPAQQQNYAPQQQAPQQQQYSQRNPQQMPSQAQRETQQRQQPHQPQQQYNEPPPDFDDDIPF